MNEKRENATDRRCAVSSRRENFWDHLAFVLFVGAFLFVLFFFPDFGVTWDEPDHQDYGRRILRYYGSGFKDRSFHELAHLHMYGTLYDVLAALWERVFGFLGPIESRHLLGGFMGVLGGVGAWKLAKALMGSQAGFFAALILLLTPAWLSHTPM